MYELQTKTFSPRELAEIVGVSQSSIKRWVDKGEIRVTRTAGGHRRIVLKDALRFFRDRDLRILRPELLGLPDLGIESHTLPDEADPDLFYELLVEGQLDQARGMLAKAYLNGQDLATLFDGPVKLAMSRLGEHWRHEEGGIFLEHRATMVCIEAVNFIRILIDQTDGARPKAVGCALAGDPYQLPTMMAGAVLTECGYHAINLGPDTPIDTLRFAIDAYEPALVWVSVTTPLDPDQTQALRTLVEDLNDRTIGLVLGGQELVPVDLADDPASIIVLSSMRALAHHAEQMTEA